MFKCRICGAEGRHPTYVAREMMFGWRDEFTYFQCSKCGCLQIDEIPEDLSKYYPDNYLSFKASALQFAQQRRIQSFIKSKRLDHYLGHNSMIGRLAMWLRGEPDVPDDWLKDVPLRAHYRMLDVGCGNGRRVLQWRHAGFADVMGVDAFINSDLRYGNGVQVLRKSVFELHDQYDFISMIHSFEHMPDPLKVLQATFQLLKPDRFLLVSIPVSSCLAWEKYGPDWVQLDAPRHLFLHSETNMTMLAEKSGFSVEKVIFDSSAFQFWGSEQYRQGIPLMDEKRSYRQNPEGSIFTQDMIREYEDRARELNRLHRGDRARFYLYKA